MADFGVKNTGFVPKRYTDIETAIFDNYKQNIDQNINVSTGSPHEQMSTPHINAQTDVWECLQDLSSLFDKDQAYGVWLDYYVKCIGLIRLSAVPTSLEVGVRGSDGVVIPDTFTVKDANDISYKNTVSYTIVKNVVKKITFKIPSPVSDPIANPYTITLDTIDYTFNVATSDPEVIRDDLFGQINTAALYTLKKLGNDSFEVVQSTNPTFDFDLTSNIHFYTTINTLSVDAGKFSTSVGYADIIVTPTTGIDSVYNFYESVIGRDRESDSELRIRYDQSLLTGDGTVEAVVSKILNNVSGITYINGYENVEDFFANSLPPHSMQVVVEGGDDQEIADKYFEHKPAGTQTVGAVPVSVITVSGKPFTVFFERTVILYSYFRITVTKETVDPPPYPDNGNETMKSVVFDTSDRIQKLQTDLTAQKYMGDIYKNISGIRDLQIEIAVHTTPSVVSPAYQVGGNIVVNRNQRTIANTNRIIIL